MKFILFFSIILLYNLTFAQLPQNVVEPDKCGFPDTTTAEFRLAASGNWGYGYDTLLYDIEQWKKSVYVTVDSIGTTVQNRTLWMLTIQDTSKILVPKKRVWIHARTHPGEVQGTWVTNEIIKILLADTLVGKKLRDSCIFNIVPMYNADGVELGYARQNANGIDIESNWDTTKVYPSQPEVTVLRNTFRRLMAEQYPISIALNMHSAYECNKFFWFHDSSGTSPLFAKIERKYIDTVVSVFPGLIMPWNSHISWVGAASKVYPESWFWYNHKEKVLALTYEDMNCSSAHSFDKTAYAITKGIADYFGLFNNVVSVTQNNFYPNNFSLTQNFPNPFNPTTIINYQLSENSFTKLKVYDILGKEIATLVNEIKEAGSYSVQFDALHLPNGVYFYTLRAGNFVQTKKMILMK